jgi:hypothetical protein
MRRLITVTQGVTEAQAIQFWYGILDKELRWKVCDVTFMSDDSPALAHVFALSKTIELNMVEEKVVTSRFNRDTTITFRGQQSTSQPRSGGGGSHGGQVHPSQIPEGWMHKGHYLHSLVNNRDNLVGHVVVFIFGGIIHRRVVDGLWLMDLNRHKLNVITMAGLATLVSVILTFTQNGNQVMVEVVVEWLKEVMVVKVHQRLGHLPWPLLPL